ncbi:MAG: molybdopterin molybdotransferase MoeA [Burkholderiales bacterium]|nr:molybdopterin molybdotransferase MoeA [Burkholderiales bacterium]
MRTLISKANVLARLFALWQPPEKNERIPIEQAFGRVTAEPMDARLTLPVKRASAMDGFAVIAERFKNGIPDTSTWVLGVDYVRADTGDDFDDCFDAVIPIEKISFAANNTPIFNVETPLATGTGVRGAGAWTKEGERLIDARLPLRAVDLAALTLGGITEITVVSKPTVAFIPTGSELVPPGAIPARGQNVNSNSILLDCLLREVGAEPLIFPIVHDKWRELEDNLAQALARSDIVVIGGGSSKGGEDFCADLLKKHGEVICHGVAAAPGRPLCLALIDGKPVINLPGPALAAFYGFDWCIRAIVCRWLGIPLPQRKKVTVTLTEDLVCSEKMSIMYRAYLRRNDNGSLEATPLSMGGTSTPRALCADVIYISTPGEGTHKRGTQIEVELLREETASTPTVR